MVMVALPVVVPVVALLALLVRVKLGSPVFFVQERSGRNGVPFNLVKFRSMRAGEGSDEVRLTGFGRRLRASSLDELPELWNVLRGEMSLVGPRPLLSKYLPLYSRLQRRRLEVLPGITGVAQVLGRNSLSWERRFALDVWYVDNRSFGVDLWILARTVGLVWRREGISAVGHASMPEFEGRKGRQAEQE